MSNKIFIAGYSLEACYVAAKLRAEGASVVFYKTGTLGYPCDDIRDVMDEGTYVSLKPFVRNLGELVVPKTDVLAYYTPYEELKITNDTNGLVNFPLRRSSFETISEYEIFDNKVKAIPNITSLADQSSNASFIYKKYLPRVVFDSLFRDHGIGKWDGVVQYSATMLAREIPLTHTSHAGPMTVYRALSYESLCEALLVGIEVVEYDISRVRGDLRKKIDGKYLIMDNRIDYVCDYMNGRAERVRLNSSRVPMVECDEFRCRTSVTALRFGHKPYWLTYPISKEHAVRVSSERIKRLSSLEQSLVVPSVQTVNILSSYVELVGMYKNKAFSLPTPMTMLA